MLVVDWLRTTFVLLSSRGIRVDEGYLHNLDTVLSNGVRMSIFCSDVGIYL